MHRTDVKGKDLESTTETSKLSLDDGMVYDINYMPINMLQHVQPLN